MHRVFCSVLPAVGQIAELDARECDHLFKVFRAAPGDAVEVLDGKGGVADGIVRKGREVEITGKRELAEPALKLHLCCALPRRQKLDQLLKQAAELGAWSIRPVRCLRSVAEGDPRERWELLLQEACKQSGNPFIPRLLPEKPLPEVLKELQAEQCAIFYGAMSPVPAKGSSAANQALLIGPEGGFASEELNAIERAGALPLNLGPHVLRLETAAVCGLAALRLLASLALLFLLVLLPAGCKRASIEKNPLMIKAEKLRSSGDAESARRHYRQLIARYPEEPLPYWALSKLCDEELNDPWEAYFCYRTFLQLAPEDAPQRNDVRSYLENLRREITRQVLREQGAVPGGAAKIAELQKKNILLTQLLYRQQQELNKLKAAKNNAPVSRRKK